MYKSNKKILITGGSGFLGYNLCNCLKDFYDIWGTYLFHPFSISGCTPIKLDITDRPRVSDTIKHINPSIIIHAAAVTSPDVCEKDPSGAWKINVEGTRNIVDAAKKNVSHIVYVSTDMVFDGEKGNYSELDTPGPVNFYGKTKLEGEHICLKTTSDCTVVRITLQYGWGNAVSSSFSDWLIKNLKDGKQAPLFTDQYRTPTYVIDTVKGLEIAALIGEPGSVYHLASPERIDRYSFGLVLASVFKLSDVLLKKSLMSDVNAHAPRPKDVSLNAQKFINHFKFQPRSVYEGIKAMACKQPGTK